MTTMLERMAAAQYAVLQGQAEGRLPAWDKLDLEARVLMLRQVRAGLELTRGATDMIDPVGREAIADWHDGEGSLFTTAAAHCWTAMLDAILAEVPT